jgi:hypothetical protein
VLAPPLELVPLFLTDFGATSIEKEDMAAAEDPEAANAVDQNTSSTAPTVSDNPTTREPEKDCSGQSKLQTTIIMVALCVCLNAAQ